MKFNLYYDCSNSKRREKKDQYINYCLKVNTHKFFKNIITCSNFINFIC